jgi:hypothetical protein
MAEESNLGGGVELEWAIVYYSLLQSGMTEREMKKRNSKIQPYGARISTQAKAAVEQVIKTFGKGILKTVKHSDEIQMNLPPGVPEPKTDVMFTDGTTPVKCSVKMEGAVQLSSAEGTTTAKLLRSAVQGCRLSATQKRELEKLIEDVEETPTKLLDPKNIAKVKRERPTLIQEFLKNGVVKRDKNYELWKKNSRPRLVGAMLHFLEENPQIKESLIEQTLTGAGLFGDKSHATANYVLSPKKMIEIDDQYIRKLAANIKIDARGKARKGVTSIAFRFDITL